MSQVGVTKKILLSPLAAGGVHWEWEFPFPVFPMGIPWEWEWTMYNFGTGIGMGIAMRKWEWNEQMLKKFPNLRTRIFLVHIRLFLL